MRLTRTALLLIVLPLVVLVVPAAPAAAQASACAEVVDSGGLLPASSPVLDRALARAKAELPGVVVVVATFPAQTRDIDPLVEQLIRGCRELQGPSGGRADRLLLIALTPGAEGQSGAFWGGDYDRTLQPELSDIQDEMDSKALGGDYAGALAAGVDEAVDVETAAGPGRRIVIWAGVGLGVGLLVAAGYGVVSVRRSRRQRAGARAAAAAARQQASLAFVALEDQHDRALLGVDALLGGIDETSADDDGLRALRAEVVASSEGALDAWARKQQAEDEAPDPIEGMDAVAARAAEKQWSDLTGRIQQAQAALEGAAAQVSGLESLMAELPGDLVAQEARVGQAGALLDGAASVGWQVQRHRDRLTAALARFAEARIALTKRRPVTAGRLRDGAAAEVAAVVGEAEHFGERRDAALMRANALEGLLPPAGTRASAAAATLADLGSRYAADDLADVAGHAADATELLGQATSSVAEVRRLADMQVQDLAGAEAAVTAGEAATARAAELLGAVEDRHVRLDQLHAELPGRADAAVSRGAEVTGLVDEVGADADPSAVTRAADAARRATSVQTGLTRLTGPGGASALSLDERLCAAEQALEAVDAEVRAARAAADEQRLRAREALDRARSAIGAAEAQIAAGDGMFFGSSVGSSARDTVAQARALLHSAEPMLVRAMEPGGAADARQVAELAGQAVGEAERARQQASDDIEREQQRRRATQRRRTYSSGGGHRSSGGGSGHPSRGGGGSRSRGGGGGRRR